MSLFTPHAITQGFSSESVIHDGNGPIMVPAQNCEMLCTYQISQSFPITTAAIVAGNFEKGPIEKGRVVAFGPHPAGGVHFQRRITNFCGEELGTDPLLINAFLCAARILESDEMKP